MNIVEFINEMGDKDLLCSPRAKNTEKQQKIASGIIQALKAFKKNHLQDATDEEFQQICKEVEKTYNREVLEKRKAVLKKD